MGNYLSVSPEIPDLEAAFFIVDFTRLTVAIECKRVQEALPGDCLIIDHRTKRASARHV